MVKKSERWLPSSGKKVEDGLGEGVRKLFGLLILAYLFGPTKCTLEVCSFYYKKSVHQNVKQRAIDMFSEESILVLAIYSKMNKPKNINTLKTGVDDR